MATYPLYKQTDGYNSPNDWLVSLAIDLAALCDTVCGGENDTNGYLLAGFSEDVAFAYHFVATRLSTHHCNWLQNATHNTV